MTLGTVYEDAHWRVMAEAPLSIWRRPLATALWQGTQGWSLGWQHVLSLGAHVLNAALVGLIACRLGLSVVVAVAAGALFAVHPLTVEAAAYLTGRAELFAAMGVLLAVLCACEGSWAAAWLALAVACGCKETALVGVALLPLARRRWGLGLLALSVVLVAVGWYSTAVLKAPVLPEWVGAQLVAGGRLLSQFVWPNALSVSYDYSHLSDRAAVLCIWVVVAVAGVALVTARTRPVVAFGVTWALAVMALRLCLVTSGSLLNEHQFYLAVAGLSIGAASLLDRVPCRR